jgi:uncharacterized membrane protein
VLLTRMSIILRRKTARPSKNTVSQGGLLMQPIMRLVLPIIGLIIAAMAGSPATRAFDCLVGALLGFAIADIGVLRARVESLGQEVGKLVTELSRLKLQPPFQVKPLEPSPPPATLPHEFPQPAKTPVAELHEPAHPPATRLPPDRVWDDFEPAQARTASSARSGNYAPPPESPVVAAIRRFFTGGNTLVRVGVIVLFFGVAFLLRYMAEHTHVPIEVRLSGVALLSIALIVLGWRLRTTRGGYALALQGGGVGILYLIVFAALRLYSILPAGIAFPLLVVIAIVSAALAVLQNSLSFALLAVSGGFLAPVLASTGQGSHVVLFSYYAVLNAGIVLVAWFKAWRPLNIAGFVFTFAIGIAWGVLKYRSEDFATTEPFLILFFLFYLGISILFTLRQPVKLTGYIDGTLIFGTPIIVFALQSAMLHDKLMALAYSAVVLSALYLTIAYVLKRRSAGSQKLLIESFIALGVVFLTLAVPLALDARWNSAAWGLEGAALIWVGCRQDRLLPRLFGAFLNLAAGCVILKEFDLRYDWVMPLGDYFGLLVQSIAAIFAARTLFAHREHLKEPEDLLPGVLYCWGIGGWLLGGFSEIHQYMPLLAMPAGLVFVTLTALASSAIHQRTQIPAAKNIALLLLPTMLGFAFDAVLSLSHTSENGGWWAWPIAFAGLSAVMYRHEGAPRAPLANSLNSIGTWLLCGLLTWELAWQVSSRLDGDTWKSAAWALIPAVFLWRLPKLVTRVKWPFARNRDAYLFIAGVGVIVYLGLWGLITNVTSIGNAAPLPYLPLLNPLDLAQVLVLLVLFRYWRFLRKVTSPGFARLDQRVPLPALAALAFIWGNALLLRTLHQWFAVPYGFSELMASTLVQTSLTLFWSTLALITMLIAARNRNRVVWLTGAVLLGIVIAKLFLVDLSRSGSVERIVSFVGVGVLMLIVGYFSPLPPARESRT